MTNKLIIFLCVFCIWRTEMAKGTGNNNININTNRPRMFRDFEEAMILNKNKKKVDVQCWEDYGGCYTLRMSTKFIKCSKLTFLRVVQYLSYVECALELDWNSCKTLLDPIELIDGPDEGLDEGVGYIFWEYDHNANYDHNDVWLSESILELGIKPEMILKVLGGELDYLLPTPILLNSINK